MMLAVWTREDGIEDAAEGQVAGLDDGIDGERIARKRGPAAIAKHGQREDLPAASFLDGR